MKQSILILSVAVLLFALSHQVNAAGSGGGGGGGGAPACTDNTYSCTDWSTCSAAGTQTRTCVMTFSCPSATSPTPKPAETQSCVPPAPVASSTPPTQATSTQTATPAPQPVCTADTWTCGGWSKQCDASGKQHRACSLTFDCSNVQTPSPLTDRACGTLQCGNKKSMKERIDCRLKLSEDAINQELAIQYLPEECRALKKGAPQNVCIDRYKALRPCFDIANLDERLVCARDVLKLGAHVSDEVKICQSKKGKERVACKAALRDTIFGMVKFRMYDLSERAESLRSKGVSVKMVSGLVYTMELYKQQFNRAASAVAHRTLVLKARAAWKQFVQTVGKINKDLAVSLNNDNLDPALSDLRAVE